MTGDGVRGKERIWGLSFSRGTCLRLVDDFFRWLISAIICGFLLEKFGKFYFLVLGGTL